MPGDGRGDGAGQRVGVDPVEADPQREVEDLGHVGEPAGQPDSVLGGGGGPCGVRRSREVPGGGGRAGPVGGVGHAVLDSGVGDGAAGHPSERRPWRRAGAVRRGRTARLPKGGRPAPRTGRQAPRNGRTRLPGFPPDASGERSPTPVRRSLAWTCREVSTDHMPRQGLSTTWPEAADGSSTTFRRGGPGVTGGAAGATAAAVAAGGGDRGPSLMASCLYSYGFTVRHRRAIEPPVPVHLGPVHITGLDHSSRHPPLCTRSHPR